MTREQLQAITKAILEAASTVAKLTPNKWDDMIADIAKAISDQVFGIFGASPELDDEVQVAVFEAAEKIRASCSDCLDA